MEEAHLLYEVEGCWARITINRPQLKNALTKEALGLFHDSLDRALSDGAVRAVLVTGAGGKAFCTGAQLGDALATEGAGVFGEFARLLERLAFFPKPTLADVRGHCLAGGMGIMLACDLAIASDDSTFGTPEVNVGLWPMMIGALIFRNVARKKAMEMILTGRRYTAAQALSMGLVTDVAPRGEMDALVKNVLEELSSKSPAAVAIGKEAFGRAEGMPLSDALGYLSTRIAEVASTEDAREGIAAFLEKRKPVFTGR
ncbi:MAG TPA: enoyl-CoA hydratase-related protein [Deltaproteobacteria bacterium]|nr:enoyl-CoA hydratase-related protein [Deltaproteobacteria bacterium]HPP79500.1 enoyl-CoA hydratase-related protein [Deltaproteobacteria bacterium]